MSGVADVRGAIAEAQERLALNGKRTVLFIDEIHRFNKAQQDALLPHVEDGTITLIGATTENPYFEVNSALLSRLRVWRLEPLTDEDVATVVRRALDDAERGLAGALGPEGGVALADEAFEHLVSLAGRRRAGGAERPRGRGRAGRGRGRPRRGGPRRAHASRTSRRAAQQRILAYDRAGDGHYDTVSAFIKSLRGNDPDGALYWLAAMIAAGEDPRFIARRLIISGVRGRRERRSAGAPGRRRGGPGARLGRPARGAVRPRPGDDLHRDGAEVEPVRARLLGRGGRRRRARLAAGAAPPADAPAIGG